MKKLYAEILGTFVLVLFGCGTAILAGQYVGFLGISLAFGLSVVVMAYAVGYISGGHFNPAVTAGVYVAGRMEGKSVVPYFIAQIIGAVLAATVIYVIAKGGNVAIGDFASNTYTKFSMGAAFLAEAVATFVFLMVILGTTAKKAASGFAGLAIGLTLAAILLFLIPVTNASVNPARSLSQALFAQSALPMQQLWLFCVAPIVGAVVAGLVHRYFLKDVK